MNIYLRQPSPAIFSNLTRKRGGPPYLSLFGLAPGGVYLAGWSPNRWCALTAPLHPYPRGSPRAVSFCGTILKVTLTGR